MLLQMLQELINKYEASDYIKLCGQQNLDEVYKNYEGYISGSTSEGFGLTLLEAVGSGLPIIGFDVRYGNKTFIDDGKNGYRISVSDNMTTKDRIEELSDRIVKMFSLESLEAFHNHSYKRAEEFLTTEVEKKWKMLVQ